jgi:hypothetical protein
MAVAIVQYDDRSDTGLGSLIKLMEQNAAYASHHEYTYRFYRETPLVLPPVWVKPFLVRDLLREGFDTVVWIDSDAVVHDFSRRLESLFAQSKAFVYASDPPPWVSPFNAGVFACKTEALPILDCWCASFQARLWSRNDDGAWRWLKGEWAGRAFEQGAFVESVLPKFAGKGLMQCVPWQWLQSPKPLRESFALHFPITYRPNVNVYLAHHAQWP